MIQTIVELVEGGSEIVGLGMDAIKRLYKQIIAAIGFMLLMLPVGLLCNAIGFQGVNIAFSFFFALCTIFVWFYPTVVVSVVGAGAAFGILTGNGVAKEIEKLFKGFYWSALKITLLVETVSFFILSFIPFAAHPSTFFMFVAGGAAAALVANTRPELGGGVFKNLLFYGLCMALAMLVFTLFPTDFFGGQDTFIGEVADNIAHKEGLPLFVWLVLTVAVVLGVYAKDAEKKGIYILMFILLDAFAMSVIVPEGAIGRHFPVPSWLPWAHHAPHGERGHAPVVKTLSDKQEVMLVQPGGFKRVIWPKGARRIESISWSCPNGCRIGIEYEIFNQKDILCPNGSYKGYTCQSVKIIPPERGIRTGWTVEETFDNPAGKEIELPKDLHGLVIGFQPLDNDPAPVTYRMTYSM